MSILPKFHNGRVCIPWWYGLGYPAVWLTIGLAFGIIGRDSMIEISTASAIAMTVCALVGAIFYVVLNAFSKYEEQRTDADELKDKIATSGRDPTDLNALTAKERWDLTKAQKFDKMFIVIDALAVLISAGLAVAGVYFFGDRIHLVTWEEYALVAFFAGLLVAFVMDMTIIKALGTAEWEKKKQAAFQGVTAVAEKAVATAAGSRKDELIAKYLEAGFSRKEAEKAAKEKLIEEID